MVAEDESTTNRPLSSLRTSRGFCPLSNSRVGVPGSRGGVRASEASSSLRRPAPLKRATSDFERLGLLSVGGARPLE